MVYFLSFLFIAFLLFVLAREGRLAYKNNLLVHFGFGLISVISFGILFYYIYHYVYPFGDTLLYVNGASKLVQGYYQEGPRLLLESSEELLNYLKPVYISTQHTSSIASLMNIRITACLLLLSFNNIWILHFVFILISFLGKWLLFRCFMHLSQSTIVWISFIPAFLLPTCVFWTTGVLKDTLFFAALVSFVAGLLSIFPIKKTLLLMCVGLLILLLLRKYVLILLLGVYVLYKCIVYIRLRAYRKASFYMVLMTFIIMLSIYYEPIIMSKIQDFHKWHTLLNAQGQFGYNLGKVEYTYLGILLKFPRAILEAFFKPFLWQSTQFFQIAVSIEKLILTIFLIVTLFNIKKIARLDSAFFFIIGLVIVLGFFSGLIAYNYGALSRYNALFMPFYCFVLLEIIGQYKKNKHKAR